jgi:protein-S-isoprenylcysteine O-methyltransferase Ste14
VHKSLTYVTVQFALLIAIAFTGHVIAGDWLIAIQIAGVLLGAWAIITQRVGNFNIRPDVRVNARLITTGPYRIIRHPMYSAVLLMAGGAVAWDWSLPRGGLFAALVVVLWMKLSYEEQLLRTRFPEYASYVERTWRVVPWVL